MTTAIATTGSSFTGADVDGLDKLAQEFTEAAQVCDEVKAACEVIVAVASFFGPFGAGFVAYLKGTVIPWLQKISEALKLMAKVLSFHSQAQKDASSSATSLPSYTTPTNLPTTSTQNYPVLPPAVASTTPTASSTTPSTGSSTVSAPPSIGGTTAKPTTGPAGTNATTSTDPTVQEITAITGLVTAIGRLVNPTATSAGVTGTATALPGTVTATPGTTGSTGDLGSGLSSVPSVTSTGLGATTATPTGSTAASGAGAVTTPTIGGAATLGGSGGIDLSTLTPLHPGDSVGVVSVPVDISPSGQITPLIHTPAAAAVAPSVAAVPASAHPVAAAAAKLLSHPLSPATTGHESALPGGSGSASGGGFGGGSGGGTGGGGSIPTVTSAHPAIASHPAALASTATHTAAHQTPQAAALTSSEGASASHDGLYSGLGQATGLGAGGAALARATLHEARQRGEGGLLGAVTLPFDSTADGAAQARIFDGELS